jgi:hypothetical protein
MGRHLLIPVTLIAVFGGFAAMRIHQSIVTPLLGKHGGSWTEKLKASAMRGGDSPTMPGLAWMGHRLRWTLAVLVVALFAANWYGNYASRTQRNFLVSSSAPMCVAVRKNSDGILCAMTDLARRRVLPQLRVLPPTSAEKLTVATLPALRSPLDADRKLFARPRPSGTTSTVYAARREPEVTLAVSPRATTTVNKPAATTKATTKKTTTAKKPVAKKKTTTAKKKATTRTTTTKTTTSTTRR